MQRGAGYLYKCFAKAIDLREKGKPIDFWSTDIHDDVIGVKWAEKYVDSANNDSAWFEF